MLYAAVVEQLAQNPKRDQAQGGEAWWDRYAAEGITFAALPTLCKWTAPGKRGPAKSEKQASNIVAT